MTDPANPLSSIFYALAAIPAMIVTKPATSSNTAGWAIPARAFHSQAGRGKQFPPVIGRPADQRRQKETADIIGRQRQARQFINIIGLQLGLNVTPAVKVEMQEFLSQNDLIGASTGCGWRSKTRSLSMCW
jgi:hypothetical protein